MARLARYSAITILLQAAGAAIFAKFFLPQVISQVMAADALVDSTEPMDTGCFSLLE